MELDLERARKGDRQAMARIVDMHYDAVYRFCARRIGPDQAQDAAQETFLTAQKRLRAFQGNSSLSTWLFGIAHNHCRNIARKRRMETIGDWGFVMGEPNATVSPPCPGEQGTQVTDHENMLINRQALREALASLSPDHREVVLLHEVDGLTYSEAAEMLGVPEGTVKSRLHHAFLNLRRALLPDGHEHVGPEEVRS